MSKEKDLTTRIQSFNTDRLAQFLQLKYRAMYEDEYRFFRATTHLFYEDVPADSFLRSGPNVWLCGDLHLENYGSYKGDNGKSYFNANDFDECNLGSCLFDVTRMVCSIFMASKSLGIATSVGKNLAEVFVETYFKKLGEGYIRVLEKESASQTMKDFLLEVDLRKRKDFLDKRTIRGKNGRKLLIDHKRTTSVSEKEQHVVTKALANWASARTDTNFFKVRDVGFRLSGTSSLGLRRYVVLVEGDKPPEGNYLLELKETRKSCLEKFNKVKQPAWASEAARIIEVQQRLLSDPPPLLNSIEIDNRNFVMKELQPSADRIDYGLFKGNFKKLKEVLEDMAAIYAWDNLRSGGRQNSAIADDLIKFARTEKEIKKDVLAYAVQYTKRTHLYLQSYQDAFKKGHFDLNRLIAKF